MLCKLVQESYLRTVPSLSYKTEGKVWPIDSWHSTLSNNDSSAHVWFSTTSVVPPTGKPSPPPKKSSYCTYPRRASLGTRLLDPQHVRAGLEHFASQACSALSANAC